MVTDDAFPPPLPPPASDRMLLAAPTRQSPAALVFIAWRFVRRLGWSAIAALAVFVFRGPEGFGVGIVGVAAATALVISSALSWWRFTFQVDGDEIIVRRGVLAVERLVIPLDRVQSVSTDQRLMHRLFDLVSVAVDTAGSSGAEFEIDAIDRPRAEALRRVASDARTVMPTVGADGSDGDVSARIGDDTALDQVVIRRSLGELVMVGLSRAPLAGLVALAPLIAYGDQIGLTGWIEARLERSVDGSDGVDWTAGTILAVLGGIVVILVIGAVLQVVREVIRNWNLTLYRTPTGLRRTAGLFTTTSRSSTVRRVQAISTDDSPIQRWFGFTELRLRAFGDNDIALPGTRWDEVSSLRTMVLGTDEAPRLDRRVSRAAVFLAVRNTTIVLVPVAALTYLTVGWWAAILLGVVPLRWATAHRRWTKRRWGLADDRLAEHLQLFVRRTTELPVVKAQIVSVDQSFFERRRGLATLRVRSAEGFVAVPLIPLADALACRDHILHRVETDHRPFL